MAVTSALALSSTAALAQSRQSTWQGLYVGINAGGTFGDMKVTDPGGSFSWDHGGAAIGGHAGYNFQFNQIVAGIEADIAWTNGEGKFALGGINVRTETSYLGSVRGRLGVAFGNMLAYATGGYGYTSAKAHMTGPGAAASGDSTRFDGWVFGGGLEAKFTPTISGRLEALHYALNHKEFEAGVGEIKSNLDQTVVRAGVTFHLN